MRLSVHVCLCVCLCIYRCMCEYMHVCVRVYLCVHTSAAHPLVNPGHAELVVAFL